MLNNSAADQRDVTGGGLFTSLRAFALAVLSLALALLPAPALAQQQQTTVLTGGMLISGLSVPPLHDARVVIRGDRIVAVGPASAIEIPAGATVIDTSGQTMMPGLIDAHAHLFMIGFGDEAG